MKSIALSDVTRVKREAKRLAGQYPKLALGQRRDVAAHELLGVRNYHELIALRKATINRSVVTSNGIAHCQVCGLSFCDDLKEDRDTHQRRHDAFEEATTALKYSPRFLVEREVVKKAGYDLLESDELEEQVDGLKMVVRGWFDRSLEEAILGGYWKQHPSFESYIPFVIGDLANLPEAAVNALVERFGRVDGVIPKGRSYWYPPKN